MSPSRFAAAIGALSFLSGCMAMHRASLEQSLRETHEPGSGLVVETRNGKVDVIADPTLSGVMIDAVRIASGVSDSDARRRVELVRIVTSRDEFGRLVVKPEFPDGPHDGDGCDFAIRTPGVQGLVVTTGNGDVRAEGCGGEALLETSNGRVTVKNHQGPVRAVTSNGDVEVDAASGPVKIDTSNGSIEVKNAGAPVEARSSNGRILLQSLTDQCAPFTLRTSNGDIRIRLTGSAAGTLRAKTSSGRIDARSNRVPLNINGSHDGRTIVIGGVPAPECRAETSNGDIVLTVD